jgi:hypothetical protein
MVFIMKLQGIASAFTLLSRQINRTVEEASINWSLSMSFKTKEEVPQKHPRLVEEAATFMTQSLMTIFQLLINRYKIRYVNRQVSHHSIRSKDLQEFSLQLQSYRINPWRIIPWHQFMPARSQITINQNIRHLFSIPKSPNLREREEPRRRGLTTKMT